MRPGAKRTPHDAPNAAAASCPAGHFHRESHADDSHHCDRADCRGFAVIGFGRALGHLRADRRDRPTRTSALAPTLGIIVGGFVVESLSWRWLFFGQLPGDSNFNRPPPLRGKLTHRTFCETQVRRELREPRAAQPSSVYERTRSCRPRRAQSLTCASRPSYAPPVPRISRAARAGSSMSKQ